MQGTNNNVFENNLLALFSRSVTWIRLLYHLPQKEVSMIFIFQQLTCGFPIVLYVASHDHENEGSHRNDFQTKENDYTLLN